MKTLKLLQRNLLYILLTAGVGIGCYYIGQERTYNKLQDCVTYGTFGISGGHYTNESFEKVDSLDFGPFRCLMMIKYDGSKIEWDYRKEYVRWDTYH